jgi:multiple sugar transport system ATP-binding protein
MATVQLNQIRKAFDATEIIKGVDLTIHDRELTVFVGPSGCGKSTLLRLIAGLEEITSGDLLIDGQRVNDVPPAKRGLALVFQSYALYPHMNVEENMSFSLKLAGIPKTERKQKVLEAARILNLESYLDRKPKELSGGQRQRVAIGRAIVRNPRVFLFDEPLSNLDAALRVRMRLELTRLHHQLGATMIYVTHDQVEAMTMADRIVVLRAGIVEQVGTPMDLYHHPRNLFVAGFIGSPKMNFLEAIVQHDVTLRLADNVTSASPVPLQPGAKLTIGIRPEHLTLTNPSFSSLPAKVQVVEHLGSESYVHLQTTAGEALVLRVNGETTVRPDDQVHLGLDPNFLHLFDSDGNTIPSK